MGRELFRRLDALAHDFLDVARAVFAARRVEADKVREGRARRAKFPGELQEIDEFFIGVDEAQIAVDHADPLVEKIQALAHRVQGALGFPFGAPSCRWFRGFP